jgi:hypothetical protein
MVSKSWRSHTQAQDRVRLYDAGQTEQAWSEPRHPRQQCSVTTVQPKALRCTPQGDIELMSKKENSRLQAGTAT